MCCVRFVSNLLCIFKVSFVNHKFHKKYIYEKQINDDDVDSDDEMTTTATHATAFDIHTVPVFNIRIRFYYQKSKLLNKFNVSNSHQRFRRRHEIVQKAR